MIDSKQPLSIQGHPHDQAFLASFVDFAGMGATNYIPLYNALYQEKGRREANLQVLTWREEITANAALLNAKYDNPAIADYLQTAFDRIQRKSGIDAARQAAESWEKRLRLYDAPNALRVTETDEEIRDFCHKRAETYCKKLDHWLTLPLKEAYHEANRWVDNYICVEWPDFDKNRKKKFKKIQKSAKQEDKEVQEKCNYLIENTYGGKIKKALVQPRCERWWRRQVRTLCRRKTEALLRELGFVGAGRRTYCSEWCLFNRAN